MERGAGPSSAQVKALRDAVVEYLRRYSVPMTPQQVVLLEITDRTASAAVYMTPTDDRRLCPELWRFTFRKGTEGRWRVILLRQPGR